MRTLRAVLVCTLCVAAGATGDEFKDYTETIPRTLVTFDMIAVPAGTIDIAAAGKPAAQRVAVKRFWIGRTEVKFDELDVFRLGLDIPDRVRSRAIQRGFETGTRPSAAYFDPSWAFGHSGYPALTVTHQHARAYCAWLSQKMGRKYRLPTEVEWEYTCRAGRAVPALTREELDATAWHAANSAMEEHPYGKSHPAGNKKPNAWGLHDMLGNAWEWCTTADGKPVARGGSWADKPEQIDARARFTKIERWSISDPMEPRSRWWLSDGNCIGFRILREE